LETMVLMVQKEVADRLTARPGSKDYALLSATAQLYADVEKVFTLPPSAFSPPPKVFSSLVRLTPSDRLQKLRVDEYELIQFLKLSFGQKRKTLWNNLKGQYAADDLRQAMSRAQLRPQIRAEALTLEASASLMRELRRLRTPASPEG